MLEIGGVAVRLGLTSFGGPIAHLGYFHEEYVVRRRWLDEATYADLIALCQTLPGPSSSRLGIAIGRLHAGIRGGVVAWLGFTLPSAIALAAFAELATSADLADAGWIHGLKLAAVAIVAQAVITMWRSLAPDPRAHHSRDRRRRAPRTFAVHPSHAHRRRRAHRRPARRSP